MPSNYSNITYDKESEMAYIYLVDPSKYKIASTVELEQNDDIMLDLGEDCPIIGIELEGEAAARIATLSTYPKYKKVTTDDGNVNLLLKLSNQEIKRKVQYPGINTVSLLFADQKCNEFIGVSIMESKWYSKEVLLEENY
ncbi:DUF2283 domain-containing protein [Priestia megaterium]|uniref:DUF2283 domain-containing protein n=1 Tax=Priestia megaterium TaxID=1404 RepID=UPI002E22EAA6|nr:DUF2283 domain-containing protein [Priestia megaterium]